LLQVVFNIFAAVGFFVIIMRMNRAPKDDPRLSRGLQLLQSKISVLEDLSDRTELQVNQLAAILDQKAKEVQAKVQLAEQHVHELRVSMERSLDVAKIFQDKIPHQEIIERQNTIKYVQAARLAHQGLSVEEISAKIDLPKGEIEFIAKVNRDQLMFNEDQLPTWAQGEVDAQAFGEMAAAGASGAEIPQPQAGSEAAEMQTQAARLRAELELAEQQRLVENLSRLQFEMQNLDIQLARESTVRDLSAAFETPKVEMGPLQKLGEEFRKACEDAEKNDSRSFFPPLDQLSNLIPQIFTGVEGETAQPQMQPQPVAQQAMAPQPAAPQAMQQVAQMQQPVPQMMQPQSQQQPIQHQPMQPQPQAAAPMPVAAQAAPMQAQQAEKPNDPVLARAMAQAKVQAALKAGAKAAPEKPVSAELSQARAMAKEGTVAQQPVHIVNGRASTSPEMPVVRKVQFPRIESPEG
jgi:hypothetical protein